MLYLIRPELKYFDTFKKAVAEYKNDTTAFCTIHPVQKMIDNIDDFEKYLTTPTNKQIKIVRKDDFFFLKQVKMSYNHPKTLYFYIQNP